MNKQGNIIAPSVGSFLNSLERKYLEEPKENNPASTLEKLHFIEKHKHIYDIHYCRAGIGFIFYYPKLDKGNYKEALAVENYYPTFEEAVDAEYNLINSSDVNEPCPTPPEKSIMPPEHEK